MGYIKKLKNNELVGGTDKHTIYPVTSTKAVFEEVSENSFKSQEYLNNHIYGGEGGRINEESITDYNIAKGTITKGKLSPQVQTMLDEGQKKALTPKGNYNPETEYEALDLVFDSVTNSSYVSLVTPNTYPVNEDDEGYEEGKWQKVMDGSYVNTAIAEIQTVIGEQLSQATTAVNEMKDDVDTAIEQANQDIRDLISESEDTLEEATSAANNAAQEATDAADTIERLTSLQVADAQVGYFECTDTAASGAAANETKITTTATIGTSTYTKVIGSHVKIKMAVANTHAAPVYLQFGNQTNTKAPLLYNGEAVSDSNSWEEGEVISVYFDGTNYQASNAMGGGSAVGKKKLNGTQGYYVNLSGETASAPTSSGGGQYYSYIKYPVKEGDVVEIKGKSGSSVALVWGLIDSTNNNTIVERAPLGADYSQEPFVMVIPSGVDFIILNNANNEFLDYEWYFSKKGSVGAYEMLTEAYLYGDLRTLAVGQVYSENEAVKTSDKQLLRVIKEVKAMNITDEIAVGDLKAYGTDANASTYKALKEVKEYNGTETEGLYAIGRPSIITISVDASSLSIEEDTNILVTIGEDTQTIAVPAAASQTKDADIAALIAAAFTNIEGWVLTDNSDGTLSLKCVTAGNNTISISSNVGETGLSITSTIVSGNTSLNQYNNGSWEDVSLAAFAEDFADIGITDNTKMWQKLSIDDLISLNTVKNTLVKTSKAESISYDNSQSGLAATNVQGALDELDDAIAVNNIIKQEYNQEYITDFTDAAISVYRSTYISAVNDNGTISITSVSSGGRAFVKFPTGLIDGEEYLLTLDFTNTVNKTVSGLLTQNNSAAAADAFPMAGISGSVSKKFTKSAGILGFRVASSDFPKGTLTIVNIKISRFTSIDNELKSLNDSIDSLEDVVNDGFASNDADIAKIEDQVYYESGMTYKNYTGNRITPNRIGFKAIGQCGTGQSAAVFGDIAFIFSNGGKKLAGCKAFNMKTRTIVSSNIPVLDVPSRTGGTAWHCNSSEFGTNYYNKDDEFPLLYIGGSQEDAVLELLVCRVVPNANSVYSLNVVQVLTMPDDWVYANVAFDEERGKIILCHPDMIFRVCTPPAVVDGEGNPISTYTFTEEDCEQTITIDAQRLPVPQDVAMHRGLLYHGTGHGANDNAFFRVIDLYNGTIINDISIVDWFTDSAEGYSFYNEHLYIFGSANIYKLWFM